MGPVRGQMVQTKVLCDGVADCRGWVVDGGIEIRCTNPVHHDRTIETTRAAHNAGISYRRIDHWIASGWVKADHAHPGTGNPRRMTEHEAAVVHLMARLVAAGVAPVTASRLSRALWDGEEARLTDALVVGWQPMQPSLREAIDLDDEEAGA